MKLYDKGNIQTTTSITMFNKLGLTGLRGWGENRYLNGKFHGDGQVFHIIVEFIEDADAMEDQA